MNSKPGYLTILRSLNAQQLPQTKIWTADPETGNAVVVKSIAAAANWRHQRVDVRDLRHLAAVLDKLRSDPSAIVIRGSLNAAPSTLGGDDGSVTGTVRRDTDTFTDAPLRWMLIDVDNFVPVVNDPVTEGADCVVEFIKTRLPAAFAGAGYYWQLSASSGAPGRCDTLRAHIWFWLDVAVNGATLTAWARGVGLTKVRNATGAALPDIIDETVFRTVQPHFIADPVVDAAGLAAGVMPAVERAGATRAGFVPGPPVVLGAAVAPYIREGWGGGADRREGGAVTLAADAWANDAALVALDARGLLRSERSDGGWNIECPFSAGHSSQGGNGTDTVYWPSGCGPRVVDHPSIVCLHASCSARSWSDYERDLGLLEPDFERIAAGGVTPDDTRFGGFADDGSHAGGVGVSGDGVGLSGGSGTGAAAVGPHALPRALFECTDLANANRFVQRHRGGLLVCAGQWYAWTGTHWSVDEGETWRRAARLSEFIRADAKLVLDAAAAMPDDDDGESGEDDAGHARGRGRPKKAKGPKARMLDRGLKLMAWAERSEDKHRIDAAVGLAKRMLDVPPTMLDADPWALNCINGTVDLRTGMLRPHRREDYLSKLAGAPYVVGAVSERWERFLGDIVSTDVAAYLQRWFGYCATGDVSEQIVAILWGRGGNGKSTVIDVVKAAMGGYAGTAAPGMLMASKGDRQSTGVADLMGQRLVIADESQRDAALDEEFVKFATGGSDIKARKLYADFAEFRPTHKFSLATNYRPQVRGQDFGIWRRLHLITFCAKYGTADEVAAGVAERVKDPGLRAALLADLSGVLGWVVRGAALWAKNGLNPPAEVAQAVKDYRSSQDRIAQFINEEGRVGANENTEVGVLYARYSAWCHENGERALSKRNLISEVERALPFFEKYEKTVREGEKNKFRTYIRGLSINS